MTKKIFIILKTLFVIILYFYYSSIALKILNIFKIDLEKLNINVSLLIMGLIDLLFMFILYLVYHKDLNKNIKDYFNNFKKYFMFGFKWWVVGLILMFVSNVIISFLIETGPTNEELIYTAINKTPIYMFFSAVICAPFIEEIIFRKSIKEIFTNDYLYIILCGFIFGLLHVLSSDSFSQLLYIIPYGLFGSIFAYIYSKTNNIFVSMTFHFIHNLIIVSYYLIILVRGA